MSAEWSVLITVAQRSDQDPITPDQRAAILGRLPGGDKWIQYPPASGRGHGFETRWWEVGDDAGSVGADATDRYLAAVEEAGLAGVEVVLVHVASAGDRLNETSVGLERRQQAPDGGASEWSVMLRAVPGRAGERTMDAAALGSVLEALRPDAIGTARDGLVEVRFWVEADDAVAASAVGSARFMRAMADGGRSDWVIVRDHVASVAEAARTAYLGVERRVLATNPAELPVMIRP